MIDPHTSPALRRAQTDLDSVLALTRDLVRIPTRGGIDTYDAAITHLRSWMDERDLHPKVLRDGTGAAVALTAGVHGQRPGPTWVLDACLDTAPFGDEAAWAHPPTSGTVQDGWLWGRGAADSKVAVAMFCHLAAHLRAEAESLRGDLVLLFDLDEHTGRFGGAKRYFAAQDTPTDIGGVMIGYPGMDKLVIGGRGCTGYGCGCTGWPRTRVEAGQRRTPSARRPRSSGRWKVSRCRGRPRGSGRAS